MEEETEPIMMYGSTYGDRQCRGYLSFKGLHDGKWISDSFYNDWRTRGIAWDTKAVLFVK